MFENAKRKVSRKVLDGVAIANATYTEVSDEKKDKIKRKILKTYNIVLVCLVSLGMVGMVFASGKDGGSDPAADVIKKMIKIICKVFRYVGVVLAVYSIGQLVMAFKNEDADSKSRATTMLVVATILIGIDVLVEQVGLESYLTS